MSSVAVADQSSTRLAVVDLRWRIERIAVTAVESALSAQSGSIPQTQISDRLAYILVAYESAASLTELLGLLRLARHIYRRTSDVMHGRSSMVNLSPALLDEWKTLVERLEALASHEA